MSLKHLGYIELPAHKKQGGFDHAAIHRARARLFVVHTCNDALDVIDCATDRYLHSIPNLIGVAGALVSDERNLVFTSNRGENAVGIFSPDDETHLAKVLVGVRPNGLAYDTKRNRLLAANVGDPAIPNSFTLSIVGVAQRVMIASIPVPGRTRWTVFDPRADVFYVNIAEPPQIVVVDAKDPTRIAQTLEIQTAGPHGLDLDSEQQRLFCACDGKRLLALDVRSGRVLNDVEISGVPDVIFFNAALKSQIDSELFVRGDPDHLIEVFMNLLDNAIKYSPVEGNVGLHAQRVERFIRVSVRDSGPGIPAEHLPHLFERFYRVEAARSRDPSLGAGDGAGLGLALAHEIARLHGGTMQVESETGRGTTFIVRLPAQLPSARLPLSEKNVHKL